MGKDHSNDVLLLIPAYNAAEYLPDLIKRTRLTVCNENMLFVNDGSADETLDILKREEVKYINLPENQGKGAALMAGFNYAIEPKYRSMLTMDADLQHDESLLPQMLRILQTQDKSPARIIPLSFRKCWPSLFFGRILWALFMDLIPANVYGLSSHRILIGTSFF